MSRKVLLVRSNPYDFDPTSYNVQEIGIGKALCDLGYDFDFVTFKKKDQKTWVFYEKDGHKARWIEKPRRRLFRWGLNSEICDKNFLKDYDVVICREYYQYVSYKIVMNSSKVILYNGPYWNMFMIKPFSMVYDILCTKKIDKKVKKIVTKSELSTKFLQKKGYTKVKTIGVGLDTSRFSSDVNINKDTYELQKFMKENECILYVGTLDKNKNYPFLIDVYSRLLKNHPNLKFVVIGKSKQDAIHKLLGKKDSTFEEKCYKNISSDTRKGIVRIEKIENSQLKFIYPLAKAFLLTSKREIFGMVLLEAMYLGAPVISSKNGGSTTLIENKDTGIVIDQYDPDIWAKNISNLLDDDERRNRYVINAQKLVEEKYNWTRIVKEILEYAEE